MPFSAAVQATVTQDRKHSGKASTGDGGHYWESSLEERQREEAPPKIAVTLWLRSRGKSNEDLLDGPRTLNMEKSTLSISFTTGD
jgi:hypothetical protein